jgi:anti-sigma regulatory factor (Ser/Thr protein kinase)
VAGDNQADEEEGGGNSVRSMAEEDRLVVDLDPVTGNIHVARRVATTFAARVGADHLTVGLAVSEAVSNIVMRAHRGKAPREFRLEAELEDGRLIVAVTDRIGMTPYPGSSRVVLGLSMLADSVEIDSSEEGMRIRMYFPRAAEDG